MSHIILERHRVLVVPNGSGEAGKRGSGEAGKRRVSASTQQSHSANADVPTQLLEHVHQAQHTHAR
jgi:hypothetical protein